MTAAPGMPPARRYATLDALRGLAALFVVARHFSDLRGPSEPPYSFLAVDLFFTLSGFVLALRYLPRLASGMGFGRFMLLRAARLYPLYILGAALGTIEAALALRDGHIGLSAFARCLFSAVTALPCPTPGFSPALYPTMVPAWSLFFEFFVANAAFALWARRPSPGRLSAVLVISGGVLAAAGARLGTIDVGADWATAPGGVPRVLFSFFMGVLTARLHRGPLRRLWAPPAAVLGAVALLLAMPLDLGLGYEIGCAAVLFPALVLFGAGAVERRPAWGALLGEASYAVYVVHYPAMLLLARALAHRGIFPGIGVEAAFLLAVVLAALLLSRFFDIPVRARLAAALG